MSNLEEVQRLAGLLNFVCKCVKSGRIYLSRILNYLRTLPKVGFKTIPVSVKHDVHWWIEFAPRYNGTSLITEMWWSKPDHVVSSDSCLTGGGCFFHGNFIQWKYPPAILKKNFNINQLECMMVVIAMKTWGKMLSRKKLIFNCDNLVSVESINSGASRDKVIQNCLRELHQVLGIYSCEIKAVFIRGIENRISDALSRAHLSKKCMVEFNKLTKRTQTNRCEVNPRMETYVEWKLKMTFLYTM